MTELLIYCVDTVLMLSVVFFHLNSAFTYKMKKTKLSFLSGQVTFVPRQVKDKFTCLKDKCLKKIMSSPVRVRQYNNIWEVDYVEEMLLYYLHLGYYLSN